MAHRDYSEITTNPYVDYFSVADLAYTLITAPPWATVSIEIDGAGYFSTQVAGDPSAPYALVEGDDPTAVGKFGVPFSNLAPLPTLYPVGKFAPHSTLYGIAGSGGARNVKIIFDADGRR